VRGLTLPPQGPGPSAALTRRYPLIDVSGTARILATCAAVKMTSIVKISGGVVERMGEISKSRTG
jgi:hypothetical protein